MDRQKGKKPTCDHFTLLLLLSLLSSLSNKIKKIDRFLQSKTEKNKQHKNIQVFTYLNEIEPIRSENTYAIENAINKI